MYCKGEIRDILYEIRVRIEHLEALQKDPAITLARRGHIAEDIAILKADIKLYEKKLNDQVNI